LPEGIHTSISANTLFHFTDSFENLQSIFINDFYPRYCLEDQSYLITEDLPKYAAIPMVCFCDIPLSQISYHTSVYGSYCIGLSKEWGKGNGINPIMYSVADSYSTLLLRESFCALYPLNPKLLTHDAAEPDLISWDAATMLYSFFTFLKPYEGEFWRNGKLINKNVQFYNEREWRYVPPLKQLNEMGLIPVMSRNQYEQKSERDNYNAALKKSFRLKFTPEDIKYIIVREEKEVLKMANNIGRTCSRYSQEEITRLITKIMSMEQIIDDF